LRIFSDRCACAGGVAEQEHFVALQNGADSKRKKYICVVWVSKALTPADLAMLNGLKDIVVKQDTPST
jgi:tRNA U54 and U55 pseudouridine synthase Pus10